MSCNRCDQVLRAAEQKLEDAKAAACKQPENQELKQRVTEAYSNYSEIYEAWVSGDLDTAIGGCES